jgi:hypothetical protein
VRIELTRFDATNATDRNDKVTVDAGRIVAVYENNGRTGLLLDGFADPLLVKEQYSEVVNQWGAGG